jgi:hypothetical protein
VNGRPDPRDEEALRQRVREALESVRRPAPGLLRRCAEAVARDRRRLRVPTSIAWMALGLIAVLAGVVVLVQHQLERGSVGPAASPAAAPSARQLLYALTGGNQLLALDRATLLTRWRAQAGGVPSSAITPGSMMALSRDGTVLYVLPPSDDVGGRTVALFDAGTGRSEGSIALSAPGGAAYRSLAVDPHSGMLYAVGQDGGHIVVTVVDPERGVVLATQVTRSLPAGRSVGSDVPYQATVTADGSRLYYSYGGADSDRSGIDWADISGARLLPCASRGGAACIAGPGRGFVLSGGHVLFSDQSLPPLLVEVDGRGGVVRRSATGLAGGLADVVLDTAGNLLAVGDCASLGGVSSIDRGSGRVHAISTPAPAGAEPPTATACGQRATLLDSASLAVSRLPQARASSVSPGSVEVVDVATARIVRSAAFTAEVADLLALR